MLFVIMLFSLSHGIQAYDLYSELQYLNGSCYPRDTCEIPRDEKEDHLWGNYTCECGVHCLRYGTCCADSPHHGKMLHVEYRGEGCQSLFSPDQDPVVAVSRCSDRWRYELQTREKCEAVESSLEDPFMAAPVTSLDTHVTYKNYFCARCNYDAGDLSMWNAKLTLKGDANALSNITEDYLLENLAYEDQVWGVFVGDEFRQLKLRFEVPDSMRKFVKKCYPKTVTQCDSSHAYNYELQYKCLSYYSPVQLGKRRTDYRNVHCAMCNGVNASSETDRKDACRPGNKKGGARPPSESKPTFSFAMLLDVNRSDGDLVGEKQVCEGGSKWDPFFKKCRTLVCALPGYVVRNGQCVES